MIKSKIDYLYDAGAWDKGFESQIDQAIHITLNEFNRDFGTAELSVTFTNDASIQILNKDHRGKDKATNVLSFPAYDPNDPHPPGEAVHLGDVVLAHETIEREAAAQDKSFQDHVMHLLVHGTLHLLGYDHEEDGEAEVMEALEISILSQLGIKNPYQDV